jgi:putative hydrolase of the HAD superfamily
MIKAIIFDLGDTVIEQRHDHDQTLDELQLTLIGGARQALATLSRSYKIGMITNTSKSTAANVIAALTALGIGKYIRVVVTSVDVGYKKPANEIFENALRSLHVRSDESLMIGNDLIEDIHGAQAVGMHTGLFDPSGRFGRACDADFTFSSMSTLPAMIAQFESKKMIPRRQ